MKRQSILVWIVVMTTATSGGFHINTNCPLAVLNPNGGERLLSGSTYTIRWQDARDEGCGGNYLLDYSIDDGNSWVSVETDPVSNTCSYDWLIPSIFSNQCLIRITDANDPNVSDKSDDSFRIYRCMSNVLGDWNGDCYVDFGDFSIIAAGWNVHGDTDMNDLAGFVQYWLDCANPYDPYCPNFGEAEPNVPADGTIIPGSQFMDNIYTRLDFFPGPTAVIHTGYFNDDYSKVVSRHQDANLGPPPFAEYPGSEYYYYVGLPAGYIPGDPYTDTLVRGTTYYWTVDETDAIGNTYPGSIWEFTILDFYAFAPDPPNEAVDVETDVLLSWLPGFGVGKHDVYIGTSWEDVNNARYDPIHPRPEFLATTYEPNILVMDLAHGVKYYWRVDEVWYRLPPPSPGPVYYIGDVWSFTTISRSAEPNFPADGTIIPGSKYMDNIYTRLDFSPGPTAVTHTGYFNDDYSKVASRHPDANLGPPPFAEYPGYEYRYYVGLPPGGVPGDPYSDGLVRGTKYYWTVDGTDAIGNTFPGEIWEFTIQDFKAAFPNPPDEATFIDTDVLLSWQPGYGVDQNNTFFRYYVYFGTDFDDVNNSQYRLGHPEPPGFLASVSEPNIAVTSLELNTTYYWKVDETLYWPPPGSGYEYYYKGDVWEFTTTPSALNNDGSVNFKEYAVPSNYRQKTGPILPADFHKDDVIDYKDLRILIPGQQSLNKRD